VRGAWNEWRLCLLLDFIVTSSCSSSFSTSVSSWGLPTKASRFEAFLPLYFVVLRIGHMEHARMHGVGTKDER
jgi:hypothetical protein